MLGSSTAPCLPYLTLPRRDETVSEPLRGVYLFLFLRTHDYNFLMAFYTLGGLRTTTDERMDVITPANAPHSFLSTQLSAFTWALVSNRGG